MAATNYIGPSDPHGRFREVWDWIVALDAFDNDDAEPLQGLLRGGEAIPPEIRPAIADIVGGIRQPNKKAAARLKVPPAERLRIAASVSTVLGLMEILRGPSNWENFDFACDREGKEPAELIREMQAEARAMLADAARDLSVSTETLENMLRDLREKMQN